MTKRKNLSKRVRFEVFKRDSFKCQYCGQSAPDVVLHVDHITAIARGGADDITNLITACAACNGGKSDKPLSDDSAAKKAKTQLDRLQERKEQIEMIAEWQHGLIDLDQQGIDVASKHWSELLGGYYSLSSSGIDNLRKYVKKFGLSEIMTAMRTSVTGYIQYDANGEPTKESVELAYKKVPGVCVVNQRVAEKPYLRDLYSIRAGLRGRCSYFTDWQAMQWLEAAYSWGYDTDEIRHRLLDVNSWTKFSLAIDEMIAEAKSRGRV